MKYLIYSVLVQFEIMLSALMMWALLNFVAIPLTPDLLSQAPKYWHLYWFVMCVHFAQSVITVKDCDPNVEFRGAAPTGEASAGTPGYTAGEKDATP